MIALVTHMPMFVVCCSPPLTSSLSQLALTIPELQREIYDGLIRMLSIVLMGRPLQHPGAPKTPVVPPTTTKSLLTSSASMQNLPETPDVATIKLALNTLGTFDFEG